MEFDSAKLCLLIIFLLTIWNLGLHDKHRNDFWPRKSYLRGLNNYLVVTTFWKHVTLDAISNINTHRVCHWHLVVSNGVYSIAVNFVTASNVYTSNGMAAFWQWLFDIAKSYISCHKSCHIGHCRQLCGKVNASLLFSCHEVAGIGHCWQLCGNVDASLPFSCHEVANMGHCCQLCGNLDASLPLSCH